LFAWFSSLGLVVLLEFVSVLFFRLFFVNFFFQPYSFELLRICHLYFLKNFLSMRLVRAHNVDCEFNMLVLIDYFYPFILFYSLTLCYFKIQLCEIFFLLTNIFFLMVIFIIFSFKIWYISLLSLLFYRIIKLT